MEEDKTPQERHDPPTEWTPDVLLQYRNVGQVRVSPDGKLVAYTVTEAVMEDEKSDFLTQLHLANADGSQTRQITFAEKSSYNPQWSPDGQWLAFTSARGEKANLYRLSVHGGEAEPLTDVKSDVGDFRWSPDSQHIAYLMTDAKTEAEEKTEKAKDDWYWVEEDLKYSRLYVISVEKDAEGKRTPRLLTTEDYQVTGGAFDWSPDGKALAYSHTRTPSADDWLSADISAVDLVSGAVTPLVATPAAESQPLYSPDGKWIAFAATAIPPRWAFERTIHIIPASGGTPRALPATFDAQPDMVGWTADSKCLYFRESHGTTHQIATMDIETGEIAPFPPVSGLVTELNLNYTRTHLGFRLETPDQPVEAYISPVGALEPVQVSQANTNFPRLPLGKTEVVRWKGADDWEIEGLLTYPTDYTPGQHVPLLLVIHGGPAGVFNQAFTAVPSMYPIAAFAARGYAVLRGNPRGSSGYGKAFRFANMKDWGGGDYQDLMRGVDHVIAQGIADPDRLGVMGWSYGGFMTSWVLTHTHRFQAASVGAGVTNLVSFTGTADIPGFIPDYFGGQPWEQETVYNAHSPVSQAKGARTPTLIQHCEGDKRVPISQGYELYNALKQQGVKVRMLVAPRQDHGPREPKIARKLMQTNLDWFDSYLRPTNADSSSAGEGNVGSPAA
jgi:dipeptidyl aminopeptidase/acylaminoacyl peptidase